MSATAAYTPNHTKPMAVGCSCAADDGCKWHPKHVELITLSRTIKNIKSIYFDFYQTYIFSV
jgi:hypothetical protein